jgi:pyruvate/2-oxoglutarate dehydrogenase complex dihydrolipoamide dehydrogenase (E3) component
LAIGEVAGSPQFTHVSTDDFRVVYDSITGGKRVTTGRQIPFCLFTDPEFARFGLSEKEAKAQGAAYRLFKIPMGSGNARQHAFGNARISEGFG